MSPNSGQGNLSHLGSMCCASSAGDQRLLAVARMPPDLQGPLALSVILLLVPRLSDELEGHACTLSRQAGF
jgi:hypothetical protein